MIGIRIAGAAVDRERCDPHVLQPQGDLFDILVFVVPAQTGLDRHGGVVDRLDDAARHFDHERHVAHHARAGAASGDLLHRASEVDVDDVGAGGLGHARRFDHRFDQVAVDLDADGAFGLRYFEFFERLGRVADQAVRRDEFGVDHIGAELLAHRAERRIGDILHRRQKQRLVAQFQISYFHRRVLYRV